MPKVISIFALAFICINYSATAQTTISTTAYTTDELVIPQCKETKAINTANVCEAYPFLSADGLRLYLTSDRTGGFGRLYISTRKSINEPFGTPEILSKKLEDGYYCATLTKDELTICMAKDGDIYIGHRKNITDQFGTPVKITGLDEARYFAPAISPDGNEIIVLGTANGIDANIFLKKTGEYQFVKTGTMVMPNSVDAEPGQFSKDGLSYYTSLVNSNGEEKIWKLTRTALGTAFSNLKELALTVEGHTKISPPTCNGDESIVMCITSPGSLWSHDDIVLIDNKSAAQEPKRLAAVKLEIEKPQQAITINTIRNNFNAVVKEMIAGSGSNSNPLNEFYKKYSNNATVTSGQTIDVENRVKVYPTLFTNNIVIDNNMANIDGATFYLTDVNGRQLLQQRVSGSRATIHISKAIPGNYFYSIISKTGDRIAAGVLTKQ